MEKLTVSLPHGLYLEIEDAVQGGGQWMSVVDFVRDGAKEKLERYKAAHGGQIPLPPGTVTMPERKRREGDR
jgi:Arc/MetJ-type ribon-helix-helix transcriptional regulator